MGSKRSLVPLIGQIVADLSRGRPCLDLFAGMCTLAGSLAETDSPIWSNDVQGYSTLVAECMTRSLAPPPSSLSAASILQEIYQANLEKLTSRFAKAVVEEDRALRASNHLQLKELQEGWKHVANCRELAEEARRLRIEGPRDPYRLVTLTFAHGYFGLFQAMQIDSIRRAIDQAYEDTTIVGVEYKWLVLALLQACSHLSSSPGHFAEFLTPHDEKVFSRIRRLRIRSVWEQFIVELGRLKAFGTEAWRARNRVFSGEATNLLRDLAHESTRPAVIYADPPYSRAQYSRYYHVLETLVRYDYPDSRGSGRYRPDRFQTPFSNSGTVASAVALLFKLAGRVGSSVVLSYPSNGLLLRNGHDLLSIVKRYFAQVKIFVLAGAHSTLGGPAGREKLPVSELVYVCTNPKFG